MIFDEYENGKSIMDIKNKLDLLGIETRRTKSRSLEYRDYQTYVEE